MTDRRSFGVVSETCRLEGLLLDSEAGEECAGGENMANSRNRSEKLLEVAEEDCAWNIKRRVPYERICVKV